MAEESAVGEGVTDAREDSVPDPVSSWVAERAEERGVSEATFLRELAGALERARDGPSAAELDAEMHGLVEDVRERVLQVKREVDAKADADHDHPGLERDTAAAESLAEDVERLDDRVSETAERVDRGFENYEEVLESLTETTDDLDAKTRRLARAVVDLREAVERLGRTDDDRVDELAREANRAGVAAADCGECGSRVRVGLLREARCPHCGAGFTGVRPASSRLFGSHTLLAGGEAPALESGDGADLPSDESDVSDIADEEGGVQ